MSNSTVANSTGLVSRVPDRTGAQWLTTSDAARMLELTVHGVRWLVIDGRLACERTRSRQMLFRQGDVLRLVDARAKARLAQVIAGATTRAVVGEPRQLSLFGKARLRLVRTAAEERAS